jgi:Trp operon repressor
MRVELEDAQWDKVVKDVEKYYTKDFKNELERCLLTFSLCRG